MIVSGEGVCGLEVEAGAVVSVVGVEADLVIDTGVSAVPDVVEGEEQALKKIMMIDSTSNDILIFIKRPLNL